MLERSGQQSTWTHYPLILRLVAMGLLILAALFGWVWWVISPTTPEQRSEVVKVFAQIAGASVLAAGGFFTWRNLRVAEANQIENQQANRKREDQTQEAQFTDRYTKAVEQLGSGEIAIRIGGIYALERLAIDSARDYPTIMGVLIAYLRMIVRWDEENSPRRTHGSSPGSGHPRWEFPADIEAIITVLRRRERYPGMARMRRSTLATRIYAGPTSLART